MCEIHGRKVAAIWGYIPRISGKTMGIVGLGRIGTAIEKLCKQGVAERARYEVI